MKNIVNVFLATHKSPLTEWDGLCMELSNDVSQWLDHSGIPHRVLWLSPAGDDGLKVNEAFTSIHGDEWRYHVVVEVAGVVHDPWYGDPLPHAEYLAAMFPRQDVVVEVIDD